MSSHDDIREALAAATPGPWDATYDPADRWTSITGQQYGEYVCPEVATCEGDVGTDAHLIANAPTWLAELLAEVDALTARAEAAEQAIQRVRELHTPEVAYDSEHHDCEPSECDRAGEGKPYERCAHCSGFAWEQLWPCSTIRALDGGE